MTSIFNDSPIHFWNGHRTWPISQNGMLVKAELLLSFCLSGGELCCTYSWASGRAWVSDCRLWERQWALATRASPDQTTARWILCKCNAMLAFCQRTDKYIGGMILAYHRHSRDVSYQRLSCPICGNMTHFLHNIMQKKMPRVLYLLLLNSQWSYIYKMLSQL